jgi:hypothetical protein
MGDNTNKTIEELYRIFVENGKQDPNWIINKIVAFLVEYKDRYDRREITGSTIRNYVKVVKLLCGMNGIATIPWKKITRGLPKGRQWADDRAPSMDEIRKLCEYPDRLLDANIFEHGLHVLSPLLMRVGHPHYITRVVVAAAVRVHLLL